MECRLRLSSPIRHGAPPAARKRKFSSSSSSLTLPHPQPLLPLLQLKQQDTDTVESRAPKRHRLLEPPPPPLPANSWSRRWEPPPPACVWATQRLAELQHAKWPWADAAVDWWAVGETVRPSLLDASASFVEKEERQSYIHSNWQNPETSSAPVEMRPDRAIWGHGQEWPSEKMDGKNHSGDGWEKGKSIIKERIKTLKCCYNCKELGHFVNDCPYETRDGNANYARKDAMPNLLPNPLNKKKNVKRRDGKAFIGATYMYGDKESVEKEKNVIGVANLAMAKPGSISENGRKAKIGNNQRKKMKRQRWADAQKEIREMKTEKLLEKIKKLQTCVWLLEKDCADMAEIMKFRSLIESTKEEYVENEAQLAELVSIASPSYQVLYRDRLRKMNVATMAAPVEKVEGDEQNMDSGKVEGRILKGCMAVSEQNELVEEVNHLKSELEIVRRDRDYQSAQTQSLLAEVAKHKEDARRYRVELEDAMRRVAALEEGGLLQLASANE